MMKQRLISGHEVVAMDEEWLERVRKHQSMQFKHGVVRLMPEGWLYPAAASIYLDKLQTFEVSVHLILFTEKQKLQNSSVLNNVNR